MKFWLILFYLLVCKIVITNAQKKEDTDIQNIEKLITSANSYFEQSKKDSAISLYTAALSQSQKKGYKTGEAKSYDNLAEIMFKNGNSTQGEKYNNQLYLLAAEIKDTTLIISTKNRAGLLLLEKGKHKEAAANFNDALSLSKNQFVKTAEINSNLGTLHLALGEKEQALQFFLRALDLYEFHKIEKGQGETYSNISSIYYLMGNVDEAIEYQKKSIKIRETLADKSGLVITSTNISQLYILKGNNETAFKYMKQAIALAEEIKNPKLIAASYAGMSVYYNRTKNFSEALAWQTKAIKLFEEIDDKTMLSRLYVSAGNLANVNNDSTASLNFFTKGLNLSVSMNNKENIANANEKLSVFYTSRKDYEKAYNYYKKYILYKDSITAKSNLSKIEEIKTQYETEKKDNEINRLNILQRLKELQIEKQQALITGNILLAKKKEAEIEILSNKAKLLSQDSELKGLKIEQQNVEIDKQQLLVKNNEQQLLIKEKEKALNEKEISTQKKIRNLLIAGLALVLLLTGLFINRYQLKKKLEQQTALLTMRNAISKDLHDEIGSTLTSISILSSVSEKALEKQPVQAKEMLHQIVTQSKNIQQNMSDIVWSIRAENENIDQLAIRIREYIAQTLEPLQVSTQLQMDDHLTAQKLPMQYRKEILLICKEAINNIAKHSGATEVNIVMKKETDRLLININDNGSWKGNTSGSGTKTMKERAGSLGGNLEILTVGAGTSIEANIPLP